MGAVGENCYSCAHSVIDEVWGEVKCTKKHHCIYSVEKYMPCEHYKKETNAKIKDNEPIKVVD